MYGMFRVCHDWYALGMQFHDGETGTVDVGSNTDFRFYFNYICIVSFYVWRSCLGKRCVRMRDRERAFRSDAVKFVWLAVCNYCNMIGQAIENVMSLFYISQALRESARETWCNN